MSKRSGPSFRVALCSALGALILLAACSSTPSGHPASLGSSPAADSASGIGMPSCAGRSGGATGYIRSPDLGPGTQLVLGRIAINPSRSYQPVPVRDTGRWRYWQKRPILIRANTGPISVSIPPSWRGRAAITYGTAPIGRSLVLISCQKPRGVWDAYAGGIYLRALAACVPLIFRLGNRSTTVRLNMAGRC
jgi:hypothetical protein